MQESTAAGACTTKDVHSDADPATTATTSAETGTFIVIGPYSTRSTGGSIYLTFGSRLLCYRCRSWKHLTRSQATRESRWACQQLLASPAASVAQHSATSTTTPYPLSSPAQLLNPSSPSAQPTPSMSTSALLRPSDFGRVDGSPPAAPIRGLVPRPNRKNLGAQVILGPNMARHVQPGANIASP